MKEYEKPIAELMEFQVNEAIMDMKLEDYAYDDDPSFSGGVEEW